MIRIKKYYFLNYKDEDNLLRRIETVKRGKRIIINVLLNIIYEFKKVSF